jgi:RNA-directed DNA polymerase
MLAHRIADRRVLRLIGRWLKAGILEDGEWSEAVQGTPQGSGISPLLSNVFLHYILDLWVRRWRRHHARGKVIVVRYCDDFVMGFQYGDDARRMLEHLKERMAKFGLELHEEKTRLIEFGRLPALDRKQRGLRRPETFAFLGFTHYCGWTRDGRFVVKLKTLSKRLTVKLKSLRAEARRRMHRRVTEQHEWLCQVLRGHYQYFGVTSNFRSLNAFYQEVRRIWFRALSRRSQRKLTWERYTALLTRLPLPSPSITHPASCA